MSQHIIVVEAVTRQEPGRVSLRVVPPQGIDLQFIYRAGKFVYWDPGARELQDRSTTEASPSSSARRIAQALQEELGSSLKPSVDIQWRGVDEDTRAAVAEALFR